MQTISIRLEDETVEKIEEIRGSEHKSLFYRNLILTALDTLEHKHTPNDYQTLTNEHNLLKAHADSLEYLIKAKDLTISTLQNEVGFLIQAHTDLKRLLPPSREEQKEKGKKWFEFWK